jgi:hypothetical protein
MRAIRRPNDLRLRMQRVAIKPAAQKPAPARALRAGELRRPRVTPTQSAEAEAPAPHSRLQIVLAWARWELTDVPAKRWRWFMAVAARGDDQPVDVAPLMTPRARGN